MTERTDWKGAHAELAAQLDQTKKELDEALQSALSANGENDRLRDEIAELRRQVERARVQGMNDVTALLLRDGQ